MVCNCTFCNIGTIICIDHLGSGLLIQIYNVAPKMLISKLLEPDHAVMWRLWRIPHIICTKQCI